MKTIYIWKNIFKLVAVVLLTAVLVAWLSAWLQLEPPLTMFLGAIAGVTSTLISLGIWKCYKFEF